MIRANPAALRRLVAGGKELKPFSQPIIGACLKASNEVNAETAAHNEDFGTVLASMQSFRNQEHFGGRLRHDGWGLGDSAWNVCWPPHPSTKETSYLLEGEATLKIAGQSD